ncbi:MAG TPA: CPBP family intramembrane glutamic endopeptidase [Nakamurella sp.]
MLGDGGAGERRFRCTDVLIAQDESRWVVVSFRVSMVLSVLVLVCANVLSNRVPGASVAIGVGLTGALVVIARGSGLGLSDLGLTRSSWSAGLRWGGGFAALAAVGYGLALVIPATRAAVAGTGSGSWAQALLQVLVVIPLGTVIPEEFAFRGVLWGLLRRRSGRWAATLVSSVLFGFWHVLPALAGGAANQAVDDVVGGGTLGVVVRVVGTVLFTGAAGVLFCELRVRSGSLLAPTLAHWSVNGLGVLFVTLA